MIFVYVTPFVRDHLTRLPGYTNINSNKVILFGHVIVEIVYVKVF
jgi:hypothetical protein